MLAFRKTEPRSGAELVNIGLSDRLEARDVLIAVEAVGVCGSDLHAYDWTPGYEFMADRLPVTLGHEFSGRISDVGHAVADLQVGDRAVCWPTVACGSCRACEAGRPHDCRDRAVIGLHRDGAIAERVSVPAANCRRIPTSLDSDIAALSEPLAIAVNAVNVAEVSEGDAVVVLGPGPIGLCTAWLARQRGAHVLLAGLEDRARLRCAEALGIDNRVDLAEEALAAAVERVFGRPVDRVIEATGATASIGDGLSVLRSSGVLVTAGIHSEPLILDLTDFIRNKHQLRAAHDTTADAFAEAVELLTGHGDVLSRMITHRLPLGRARAGFELAKRKQAVKVMLLPGLEAGEAS